MFQPSAAQRKWLAMKEQEARCGELVRKLLPGQRWAHSDLSDILVRAVVHTRQGHARTLDAFVESFFLVGPSGTGKSYACPRLSAGLNDGGASYLHYICAQEVSSNPGRTIQVRFATKLRRWIQWDSAQQAKDPHARPPVVVVQIDEADHAPAKLPECFRAMLDNKNITLQNGDDEYVLPFPKGWAFLFIWTPNAPGDAHLTVSPDQPCLVVHPGDNRTDWQKVRDDIVRQFGKKHSSIVRRLMTWCDRPRSIILLYRLAGEAKVERCRASLVDSYLFYKHQHGILLRFSRGLALQIAQWSENVLPIFAQVKQQLNDKVHFYSGEQDEQGEWCEFLGINIRMEQGQLVASPEGMDDDWAEGGSDDLQAEIAEMERLSEGVFAAESGAPKDWLVVQQPRAAGSTSGAVGHLLPGAGFPIVIESLDDEPGDVPPRAVQHPTLAQWLALSQKCQGVASFPMSASHIAEVYARAGLTVPSPSLLARLLDGVRKEMSAAARADPTLRALAPAYSGTQANWYRTEKLHAVWLKHAGKKGFSSSLHTPMLQQEQRHLLLPAPSQNELFHRGAGGNFLQCAALPAPSPLGWLPPCVHAVPHAAQLLHYSAVLHPHVGASSAAAYWAPTPVSPFVMDAMRASAAAAAAYPPYATYGGWVSSHPLMYAPASVAVPSLGALAHVQPPVLAFPYPSVTLANSRLGVIRQGSQVVTGPARPFSSSATTMIEEEMAPAAQQHSADEGQPRAKRLAASRPHPASIVGFEVLRFAGAEGHQQDEHSSLSLPTGSHPARAPLSMQTRATDRRSVQTASERQPPPQRVSQVQADGAFLQTCVTSPSIRTIDGVEVTMWDYGCFFRGDIVQATSPAVQHYTQLLNVVTRFGLRERSHVVMVVELPVVILLRRLMARGVAGVECVEFIKQFMKRGLDIAAARPSVPASARVQCFKIVGQMMPGLHRRAELRFLPFTEHSRAAVIHREYLAVNLDALPSESWQQTNVDPQGRQARQARELDMLHRLSIAYVEGYQYPCERIAGAQLSLPWPSLAPVQYTLPGQQRADFYATCVSQAEGELLENFLEASPNVPAAPVRNLWAEDAEAALHDYEQACAEYGPEHPRTRALLEIHQQSVAAAWEKEDEELAQHFQSLQMHEAEREAEENEELYQEHLAYHSAHNKRPRAAFTAPASSAL